MPFQQLLVLIGALSIPSVSVSGGFQPMPIPPGTKTSATGAGEITTNFSLGEGVYDLYASSIRHTQVAESCPGRISYIYTTGDGSEIEVVLASGYITKYTPLVLPHSSILTGPGFLRSTVFHMTSMTHIFNVEYRRFTSTAELGMIR